MASLEARRVQQFVEGLERNDRYMVMLFYADGLTPVEIGQVLDLPSNRVQKRLSELRLEMSCLSVPGAKPATARTMNTDGLGGMPAAFA